GSIILYAAGEELLSDIGYTHTKYRGWTTHTASHNTVVIDQLGQDAGTKEKAVTGNLLFYDDQDTHVKVIDVDASPAYSTANTYRRRLIMVHAAPGFDYIIDRFDVEGGANHDWFLHGMCEEEGTLETSIVLDKPLGTLVPEWGGSEKPKSQYDTDLVGKRIHAYSYMRDIKAGTGTAPWTASWKYKQSGLRTHILSPEGTEVFRFRSPSVRLAKGDDGKLDEFQHNGIMQRHSGKPSTFLTVHEPFRKEHWIKSVKVEGEILVLRYHLNGQDIEDRVTLRDNNLQVSSSAGWEYQSGTAYSGKVAALAHVDGKWKMLLDREVKNVKHLRLDLSDGGTRYYPVMATHGK